MLRLGVNIDHVATVRQARYRAVSDAWNAEPSPVLFAQACAAAGAHGITAHLREDRRHVQEHDLAALRSEIELPINLEMACTPAMLKWALRYFAPAPWSRRPRLACLVPERRNEVTTEGGLDAADGFSRVAATTLALQRIGVVVSLFIDPDAAQVRAARDTGADFVELHTGAYANARAARARLSELRRLAAAARLAHELGLGVNAGHGLHPRNLADFLGAVPHLHELNIGHAIVARALVVGAAAAVREFLAPMRRYRG
jgi:pyridoxine 5-phosphate synthase